MSTNSAKQHRQRGYALVIMLVILVAGGLYALVNQLNRSSMQNAQEQDTANALRQAREALLAYAVTYREEHPGYGYGYLPCPDMASDDTSMPGGTGGQSGNCDSQGVSALGLLPYRSLELPDIRDGSGNCLWYAVSGTHKNNPKNSVPLDESTKGQFSIIDPAGNTIVGINGPELGVAAIVFSPGPAIGQQSRALINKPCSADSTQAADYLESLGPTFTQGVQKSATEQITSNDQLSWLTAKEIFDQAKKRNDYNNNAPSPPKTATQN
jgi:type II secretory pathway pseudopilin PulG